MLDQIHPSAVILAWTSRFKIPTKLPPSTLTQNVLKDYEMHLLENMKSVCTLSKLPVHYLFYQCLFFNYVYI